MALDGTNEIQPPPPIWGCISLMACRRGRGRLNRFVDQFDQLLNTVYLLLYKSATVMPVNAKLNLRTIPRKTQN